VSIGANSSGDAVSGPLVSHFEELGLLRKWRELFGLKILLICNQVMLIILFRGIGAASLDMLGRLFLLGLLVHGFGGLTIVSFL